jgi:hypothetical protein
MTIEMTMAQMLAELTITFPTLWKRPLSEFGHACAGKPGVWTGADGSHLMPDGEQIFNTLADGTEAPYWNPPIHEAFDVWLANRGWGWENYDGATIWLVPLSYFDLPETQPDESRVPVICRPAVLTDDDLCPF